MPQPKCPGIPSLGVSATDAATALPILKMILDRLLTAAAPAHATLLKNVRPGVICKSADALAKLTLPNGSSRSAGPNASPAYKQEAKAGGCVDMYGGGRPVVFAKEIRKNTAILLYQDLGTDDAPVPYYAPNVDFVPYTAPHTAFNEEMARNCPTKFESFFVFDSSEKLDMIDSFMSTLPLAIQKRIPQQAGDKCEAGWRCQYGAEEEELSAAHLDRQWADYVCKQWNPS